MMLAVGLLSYYCRYQSIDDMAPMVISFGLFSAALPPAMILANFFYRGNYSYFRFCLWLLSWTVASTMGSMFAFMILMMTTHQTDWRGIIYILMVLGQDSVFLAGTLYFANLPFLILAFKSPFYENRFEKLFHIEKDYLTVGQRIVPLDDDPISTQPTTKPVAEDDLLGRWEFIWTVSR